MPAPNKNALTCQEVVAVHDHVHEAVEEAAEGCMSSSNKLKARKIRNRVRIADVCQSSDRFLSLFATLKACGAERECFIQNSHSFC